MKLAIMQPYFFPYLGYWQLIHAVDKFIVYDNIQYTKKGWINRNYFLRNDEKILFSIPLKKDSDFLDIVDRKISSDFNREKLLNQLRETYKNAPFFNEIFPTICDITRNQNENLFNFILNSIKQICEVLSIKTEIVVSSHLQIDHTLKSEEKVIAFCKYEKADVYINAIGGQTLYNSNNFCNEGVELQFIKMKTLSYPQKSSEFVPYLSIIDVLMNVGVKGVKEHLNAFELKTN
jgi:hypothetical protein